MDCNSLKIEMKASLKALLTHYAAVEAVEIFLKEEKLPGDITLFDQRGEFTIREIDWSFLLPDAIHDVGTVEELSPEMYDRLNCFIAAKNFRMQELGYSSSYPIELDPNPPTEHNPEEDEEVDSEDDTSDDDIR